MNLQLLKAIRSGNLNEVRSLIQNDINLLNETTPQGGTPLHLAARFGHTNLINEILAQNRSLLTQKNQREDTALHVAARAGHINIVKSIIQYGMQCDTERGEGENQVSMVISMKNADQNLALHDAIYNRHQDVALELVLQIQAKPELLLSVNKARESPLSLAVDVKLYDVAKAILDADISSVFHRNSCNKTPLHIAILRNDFEMVKMLLKKAPEIMKIQDKDGKTPLHYAAALGYLSMTKELIRIDPSSIYQSDQLCRTPLHLAAQYGRLEVLRILLQTCPDSVEQLDNDHRNVLHIAAQSGMTIVVRYLIKLPDIIDLINAVDVKGNTPLHLAASNCCDNVVCVLVDDTRVDLSLTNIEDMTPLDVAEYQAKFMKTDSCRNSVTNSFSSTLTAEECQIQWCKKLGFQMHLTIRALKEACAKRGKHLEDMVDRRRYQSTQRPIQSKRAREVAATLTLMATLVATVTFNAAFTLPGGFKSDGPNEGMAVLARKTAFIAFAITDAIALTSSMTAAVILFWSSSRPENESFLIALSLGQNLTWTALIAMGLAFVTGFFTVLSEVRWLSFIICLIGCVFPAILYALPMLFEWGAKQPRSDLSNSTLRRYALLARDILEGNLGYRQ